MVSGRQHELAVLAFDLLHRDGRDLTGLPLVERRRRLERLHTRSDVPCLYLVGRYDDGARLLLRALSRSAKQRRTAAARARIG
jgi:ATP-dependent DNA ligase